MGIAAESIDDDLTLALGLADLADACATLLAFLARVGETSDLQTEQAFADQSEEVVPGLL